MAEKIIPKKIAWSEMLITQFEKAGFTPVVMQELISLGEVWRFGSLYVVIRSEGSELVWMASLGVGIFEYAHQILLIAKRAGANTMRFHVADDEKAIVRFWRKYNPISIDGEGFSAGAYRVSLGGLNE